VYIPSAELARLKINLKIRKRSFALRSPVGSKFAVFDDSVRGNGADGDAALRFRASFFFFIGREIS